MERPRYFDLSKPRRRARSAHIQKLLALKPGQRITHDHTGRSTPITKWIAQLRRRYGHNFQCRPDADTRRPNTYRIWIADKAKDA